ncbi:hypothetical protein CkaCkLH20_10829 [Colletotrichum karsti]|uniref:TM7S3/TM198-like domain-containing protein n=1 Tax=Colletotrichum karsti TaxID=1095194 RepID=A0A9P6HYT9_9PEZI|nr:uncharacterized protein CkaCkLH20_10829 [Colletotrichum karsti]KAF9871631.1 hypothetical protein CkaCkLH20_10829 [Colletotrichum karsti]
MGSLSTTRPSSTVSTIPEGQLPLEPKITPGWAVAGVILLCVGIVYTLIGIRHPVMHNTLSVAFAAGLGITVLIVYLVPLPVSNGSQGGFVVAAILPGVVVGIVASLWFNEITECFACGLGGFCFSMWLLCLHEGGLLSGVAKVVFIVVFTLASFATYFTRWTRDWSLIINISFTGATSTVIGIDCLSRAGLKEFWAYVWHLNDNLFPVGTTTYPLTKGIRVELAAIIVIFCAGIISQKRLWSVIKDRRTKRQEELAEEQRERDEEEVNIGKQIEAENARERRAWERVHGDQDSGFARDSESEKAVRYSQSASIRGSGPRLVAEMQGSDVPPPVPPKTTTQVLMTSEKENDGTVTVRVAPDGVPAGSDAARELIDEKQALVHTTEIHDENGAVPPVPEVVPLPFKFPVFDDSRPRTRASTVATIADDDEDQADAVSKRSSFAKRVSQGSATLMRRVSQRTSVSRHGNIPNEDEVAVLQHQHLRKPTDDSIAATIDSENDSGTSTRPDARLQSVAVITQSQDEQPDKRVAAAEAGSSPEEAMDSEDVKPPAPSPDSNAAQPATEVLDAAKTTAEPGEEATTEDHEAKDAAQSATHSQKAKSTASNHSTPVSLTREHLPSALSNIALHYRTNEWAKHLSHAEAPVPETLPIVEQPVDKPQRTEIPVPVMVEELKQTALTATPAPVPTPSPGPMPGAGPARAMSTFVPPARTHSRNNSWGSGIESATSPPPMMRQQPKPNMHHRRKSSKNQIPTVQTIAEEGIQMPSRSPSVAGASEYMPYAASPVTPGGFVPPPPPPGIVPFSSPQSLLAQRSVTLRNKTYGILTGASSTPDLAAAAQRPPSEVGSVHSYSAYQPQMPAASLDDLPLSQRKEIIRRQSSMGTIRSSMSEKRSSSNPYLPITSAEKLQFDSHQPVRFSNAPSQEARDARLASFRDSVQRDLRAGMAASPAGANGRDMTMMFRAASSSNLAAAQAASREADMQRNIDLQRSFLMSQKDAEAKRREKERIEKERANQAFTSRMQTGEMFDLHREAMRRMQQGARDS